MEKKCPKCKRWFDTGEFAEEYCPYCGQVLSEADREKIRRRDYFFRRFLPSILVAAILMIFIVVFFIGFITDWK